ncbi:alpha/beta fold hydrolase [Amycolatopsis roodepoortensis]|uniref:Pimeloyl-ACP methyl ester carboxylesterase n=1 Tax=Amycolatopsis roodepoortensis TaxID=700274 RepID=A0ABR9L0G6_9PSEU|nr:alpha/beta fold hydrolase [Amycolatopsis roodepoortensis]MBE1573688.1 pimeloyl-ACP methyl ester carboxylesterase [Amycolatopsis roodepoortensis]
MFHRAAAFVVALVLLTACGSPPATAPPYENVTRADAAFASQFRHEFADVDGVKMHYVTGGKGAPLVLLHGWPQTWYGWHRVMPALAEHFTVYALDLPGLGDSAGSPPSYDKATLARYVHGLVAGRLGLRDVRIAGHDLGAAVAFQYAAQFPGDITKLAYLDLPLPGPALDATAYRNLSWHIAFHSQKTVPEAVVGDDVREYLSLFYPQVAYSGTAFGGPGAPSPFDDAEIDEYARTYTRPEVLHGGFELYRTLGQDATANVGARSITTPTLLMTAEGLLEPQKATLAPRVANLARAVEVPRAGHWLAEENPEFVSAELVAFLK